MDGSAIVTILVSLFGAGTIGVIINALISRRKIGADATQVITQAAASLVSSTTGRLEAVERELTAIRSSARKHEAWDRQVVRQLRAAGLEVADPPPLIPE